MTLFIAHSAPLDTTTGVQGGGNYTAVASCALQVQVPDARKIRVVEWGWAQSSAAVTFAELATTDTATTSLTAHSTTTVLPVDAPGQTSGMTMGTGGTGFSPIAGPAGAPIITNTTLRRLDGLYVVQTFVKQFPLGAQPVVGNGTTENFLQLRVLPSATIVALGWIVWEEL